MATVVLERNQGTYAIVEIQGSRIRRKLGIASVSNLAYYQFMKSDKYNFLSPSNSIRSLLVDSLIKTYLCIPIV
jgi:hypothetical protein